MTNARRLQEDEAMQTPGEVPRLSRTLITGPQVLLADPPHPLTSSQDSPSNASSEHSPTRALTVAWVTHDLDQLWRLADSVLVLLKSRGALWPSSSRAASAALWPRVSAQCRAV